ncbi:MAG: hypothetical protein AAF333_15560 [Planctomycetota bacterium]
MRTFAPLLIAFVVAAVLHATLLPVGASYVGRTPVAPGRADLRITLGDTPAAVAAGRTLTLEIELSNVGNADAPPVTSTLALSRDRRPDDGDAPLPAPWPGPVVVAAGQTRHAAVPWAVSEPFDGPYFLVAQAEADALPGAETDAEPIATTRSIWIDGAASPVIAVDAIDAPSVAFAGGSLSIGHTLHNAGEGWARGEWTDTVWLSIDDTVSDDDVLLRSVPRRRPLAPSQSDMVRHGEVALPFNLTPGPYRLIVRPGADEHQTLSVPLNLRAPTHPDLVVRNVKLPSQIVLGRPAPLGYDVVNRSPADARAPEPWIDAVYLSLDDQLSPDDVLLTASPAAAELPGNHRLRRGPLGVTVSADQAVSAQMFVLVVADDEGRLDEGEYESNNAAAVPVELIAPADLEPPDVTKLGRDDEPPRVTVAWIPHDAFEELRARASRTEQPIVQDRADPVPNAPLEREPEDAAQAASRPPSPPSPVVGSGTSPPAARTADRSRQPFDNDAPGELPTGQAAPVDQPGNAAADTPGLPIPTPPDEPPPPETPPTVVAEREGDKPTSAPRDDREADPTRLIDAGAVRPGGVLVGPGLEIKTFRPRFSAVAQSTVPRNPTARITFDTDGTVIDAELSPGTGFENVDAPILSSLYRWKAQGARIENATAPFRIQIDILLNDAPIVPPKADP